MFVGNSQGGVLGGAVSAVTDEWERAVLGVPGVGYNLLLPRSSDWPEFQAVFDPAYPDPIDRVIVLELIQLLWDRGENSAYVQHLTADPYEGVPAKTVLLVEAFGDHQVANVSTAVLARTIGAAVTDPALEPGRSDDVEPYWGIPVLDGFPATTSVLSVWDYGTPAPPTVNLPPTEPEYGEDPHGAGSSEPGVLTQALTFLTDRRGHRRVQRRPLPGPPTRRLRITVPAVFRSLRPLLLAVMALVLLAAACGGDDSSGEAAADTTAPTDDTTADGSDYAAVAAAAEWEEHVPGGDCQCADGSEFSFWSREGDPEKVVLFFQGGGACFTAEMCSFTDGTYTVQADGSQVTLGSAGVFDAANEANPFRDYSFVFVPYCTGDIHLGDAVHDYGGGLSVAHKGYANASAGLDYVVENFPDASEVFVTGSSAGGVPSPMFAGLASDALPDADIAVPVRRLRRLPQLARHQRRHRQPVGHVRQRARLARERGPDPGGLGRAHPLRPGRPARPRHPLRPLRRRLRRGPAGVLGRRRLRGRGPAHDHSGQRGPDRGGRRARGQLHPTGHRAHHPRRQRHVRPRGRGRALHRLAHRLCRGRRRSTTWSAPTARTPPTPEPGGPGGLS